MKAQFRPMAYFSGVGVAVESRGDVHRKVRRDVEVCQLGINVGIDDGNQVDTDHTDDTEVAVSPVEILSCLQH